MPLCGLDFGTSNSAVALPSGAVLSIDRGGGYGGGGEDARLFRSVLFFPEESREFLAGSQAIEEYLLRSDGRLIQSMKGWLPSQTFHTTEIHGKRFRLEDLAAMLLRRIREAAERAAGVPLDAVTLGRPALFSADPTSDALAERRLATAAELAGFRSIRFVIEPIAAALAYEATLDRDELVLVADFGAGTSDITIMQLGPERREREDRRADVIASDGVAIGGDRFDAAIMRDKLLPYFGAGSTYDALGKRMPIPSHILNKLLSWHEMSFIRERSTQALIDRMLYSSDAVPAIEALYDLVEENLGYRLFRAIEAAKIQLSKSASAEIVFDEARIRFREPITRIEFERAAAPLLAQLAECVDNLLVKTALSPKQIDAVFLTGGSCQIPAVRSLFLERFGAARLRTANAFTSVAEGLGRSAGRTVS